MTATAQGAPIRCDYAACQQTGTVEVDAWLFCTDHAGKAPRPVAIPTRTVPVPQILTPRSEPTPVTELLKQAAEHSSNRVRRAGERIETQLGELRTLIRDLAADEAKQKAAAALQRKAREDVARLEKQLADAKAALKATGGRTTTPTVANDRTLSPAALEARRANAATARAAKAAKAAATNSPVSDPQEQP